MTTTTIALLLPVLVFTLLLFIFILVLWTDYRKGSHRREIQEYCKTIKYLQEEAQRAFDATARAQNEVLTLRLRLNDRQIDARSKLTQDRSKP